jgi:glycosyltransferase involved in cell wall biosynthesis
MTVPPLRIVHVLAPARVGGLESVVAQLAAGQRAAGHDAQVAAVLQPGSEASHPLLDALATLAVPVHRIVVGPRDYRGERRRVRDLLSALSVDVLHTHGYRSDVMIGGLARRAGCARVTTLHGFTGGGWRNRVYEWLQVRAAVRADAAIAVSTPIADRLKRGGAASHTHLLRNAMAPEAAPYSRADSRVALGAPGDAFVVGWVGRLTHEKGPDLFVEALALADDRVHGLIVGDGPMRESLRALAHAKGLSGRLRFAGIHAQASRYLAAFDALALTSRTEGTPMIVLEAMWASVPILATAVGGVPDMLSSHEALLCDPNRPSSIAQAMDTVLRAPDHGRQLAAHARERVATTFGVTRWVDAHVTLYHTAIQQLRRL